MATQPSPQAFAVTLLELAKDGKIEQLEERWIEQIAALPNQGAFYKEWLKLMRKADGLDRAESLLALVLDDRLAKKKFKLSMRILLTALPYFPKSEVLRPALVEAVRGYYGDLEMREEILKLSDLAGSAPLTDAFQAFQEWSKLTPGQVYQHYDWGEGIVQTLDLATSKVTLLFTNDLTKVLTVEGVKRYLKFIEPTQFLALRAKDPEMLRKTAESDPAEVVKLVLASQPNHQIKQGELKTLLSPSILASEQWNSWWSKGREALKLDPYIDFDASGGAHTLVKLRDEPRTFEQEIEERFFADDAGTALKAELIRQLARHARDTKVPPALGKRMGTRLIEDWQIAADNGPAARLEIAYMLEDLASALPEAATSTVDDQPILAGIDDYTVLFEMDHVDYGIRVLTKLIERDGEAGCKQAATLLPRAPVKLAQAIWEALDEENHRGIAIAALEKLLDNPLSNPETYAWAVRAALDGTWSHLEEYFPPARLVPEVLDEMETWQRMVADGGHSAEKISAAKTLLSRMRTLLGANKMEVISRAVLTMSREMANRLRHTIQVHNALASTFKPQAERIILITRKDLEDVEEKQKSRDLEVHFCTTRSYTEKVQELRTITSVKIPQNSKIIEEARMEGDLKENAGYQYAKEEQKMYVQQQASLSDLLSRARIVHASEIDPSTITFGTQIRVKNLKLDAEETYIILGRWEANPERHILSQQAPLAQQFMGHRNGDTVKIDHPGGGSTMYEVIEITNALASGEWDTEAVREQPVES